MVRRFPCCSRSLFPTGQPTSQSEVEAGAALDLALTPDASSVAGDDALHRGQANARAFKLRGAVQPLEWLEELVRIGHVEPGAVVAHEEAGLPAHLRAAKLDVAGGMLGGELPGVAQQILQHNPQQPPVAAGHQVAGDIERDAALRLPGLEAAGDSSRHLAQVCTLAAHLRTAEVR